MFVFIKILFRCFVEPKSILDIFHSEFNNINIVYSMYIRIRGKKTISFKLSQK